MARCLILSLLLMTSTVRCIDREEGPNYHKTISFVNNSYERIYVARGWGYDTDPDLGGKMAPLRVISYRPSDYLVNSNELNKNVLALSPGNSYESRLEGDGRIMYLFIIDADEFDALSQSNELNEDVVIDYRLYTLEDLRECNFLITYPFE